MLSRQSTTPEVKKLLTGLAFRESRRWHGDRLWFADWGAQEVVASISLATAKLWSGWTFRHCQCASTGCRMGACLLSRRGRGCSCGNPMGR
jgi:hypothetical protein